MPKEGNIEGMPRVDISKSRKNFMRILLFFLLVTCHYSFCNLEVVWN